MSAIFTSNSLTVVNKA